VLELQFDFEEIDRIINARSLAVVGASGSPGKFGYMHLLSQKYVGFDGPVYLVNPREKEIMGETVYPDLPSLPEVPELVCLTIPAHRSLDVLRDCAQLGVKGVIMIAAGFKEIGGEGRALESEALEVARKGGFRIIGPNCFGIYNPRNGLTLTPGFDFTRTPGDVAFISQSGGFSVHLAREGQSLGIGFSAVISYGNAADLNESDFLRYFARDPQTSIIAGYLEGAGDGRDFADALVEAASAKPVLLWKVGKHESSVRAVVSHTGSLSGASQIWEALLRQVGAIEVSGIDEMLDVLVALKKIGRNPGRRLMVSGGGGGLGAFAADLAEAEGLEVPALAEENLARMQAVLGRMGAVASNPLDIGMPLIPMQEFEGAMREAASNPTTDLLIFDLAMNFALPIVSEQGLERTCEILIQLRRESGKPIAVVLYSRSCDPGDLTLESLLRKMRKTLLDAGVAVFPSMPRAVKAIARVNSLRS
jgi:acetate---CoA ligase (ADP-forming) subunit alpha